MALSNVLWILSFSAVLAVLTTAASSTAIKAAAADPFSPAALQPSEPAPPIKTTYTLLQEISAWADLSVLLSVFVSFPDLVDAAVSDSPFQVFAPTNQAFLNLVTAFLPDIPANASTSAIVEGAAKLWQNLQEGDSDMPTVKDVITYHLVAGDFSEEAIAQSGNLTTLLGLSLNTKGYPVAIIDEDDTESSMRLGRQIAAPNGRISFIDSVLLPFDVKATLSGAIVPSPSAEMNPMLREMDEDLFKPFRSLVDFVVGRTDLYVLLTLVSSSSLLQEVLTVSPALHVFAPTDMAFIELAIALLPEIDGQELLPTNISASLGNAAEISAFATRLATLSEAFEDLPSLEQIVAYHVVNTSKSYEALQRNGPQPTLFSNKQGMTVTINITEAGVQDADPSRGDAKKIASFATGNGYVTVIDGVLAPFDSADAIAAVLAGLGAGIGQPSPTMDVTVISEPSPSPSMGSPGGGQPSPSPSPVGGQPSSSEEADGPGSGSGDGPACFPGTARVTLGDGRVVRMDALRAGHAVEVGDGATSKVFLFSHRRGDAEREFVKIETASGNVLALTPGHYLYLDGKLTAAGSVRAGDVVETRGGLSRVNRVSREMMRGLFAPHTLHGDLLVDGVRVSGYSTAVHPRLAHALLAPVRMFVMVTGVVEPLGGLLYDGADAAARLLPKGPSKYCM